MPGSVSVVLRLAGQALDEGRLAGEVELVESGERTLVGNADELISFVCTHRLPIDDAGREEPPGA